VAREPVIKSLTLQGFRSIAAERIELDNPTFLVGRNGSGKSNIVDAFAFLAEAMTPPLEAAFTRRGGFASVGYKSPAASSSPELGLAVELGTLEGETGGGHYSFQARALPDHRFTIESERGSLPGRGFDREGALSLPGFDAKVPHVEANSLMLPIVGGYTELVPILRTLSSIRVYSIDPNRVRELQDPDSGLSLNPDGSNAASVLQRMARETAWQVERIGDLLGAVVPHEISVRSVQYGNKLALQFTQRWGEGKEVTFEAASISEGTLRVLGLLLAVFQQPPPSLILIEEPEASIHPGALGLIADVIRVASDRTQVIVTTHSPELLDAKWIEDRHLRLVRWENGETRVSRISDGSRRVLQEHLAGAGELLRSNSLDPAPLRNFAADQIEHFRKTG
jgi:predicted ATPase